MPEQKSHLTFGVTSPDPRPLNVDDEPAKTLALEQIAAALARVDPPLDGSLPEQVAMLVQHVQRQRACMGLLASLMPPHLLELYRRRGREQGILGPDWSPEPVSRKTVENVIGAAREVDAHVGGEGPGRWTLAGERLDDDTATAFLSLHDYLNDVSRETGGTL